MAISYKRIEGKYKTRYFKQIVNFYNRYFPEDSNTLIAKNSSIFWLAIKNRETIGITRILTDYSRNAILIDLIIRKAERNRGVGKHLVNLVSEYCQKKGIKHLILTTDPRHDWLTNFYKKLGFKLVTDQSLMEFRG